jgi:hypothetical protein
MKIVKILIGAIAITLALYLADELIASEGTVELRSTTGNNYRCYTSSLLMQDLNYTILVSCRDLIYPAGFDIFNYVLWATPADGDKPIKLGKLDFGKKQFRIKKAFSNLFITTEQDAGVRSPAGEVVMRGGVQPISFLASPTTPTPTPEGQEAEEELAKAKTGEPSSVRERLSLALRRAGVVAVFAFAAVLGLIFVITRSRG